VTDLVTYLLSELKAGHLPKSDVARWLMQYRGNQRTTGGVLHPMLGRNTSNLEEQRFSTKFTGEEHYLRDHLVLGRKVLPAVCCLEMARAAVVHSLGTGDVNAVELKNILWSRPIVVVGSLQVHIALHTREDGSIEFEIFSQDNGEEVLHAEGRALPMTGKLHLGRVDLEQLRCGSNKSVEAEECYQAFSSLGLEYGPSQRGLQSIILGQDSARRPYALARIEIPEATVMSGEGVVLHPSIADSALQSVIGLRLGDNPGGEIKAALPYALDRIRILSKPLAECWAYVRPAAHDQRDGMQRLDIDLCEDSGDISVSLRGLALRPFSDRAAVKAVPLESERTLTAPASHEAHAPQIAAQPEYSESQVALLTPQWDVVNPSLTEAWPASEEPVLIVGGTPVQRQRWKHFFFQALELEVASSSTIAGLRESISTIGKIAHVIWLAPAADYDDADWDGLLQAQDKGVMALFRLIKAMLLLGYGDQRLGWTIVTRQTQVVGTGEQVDPAHASVHGLIGSMAKEYEQWPIRLVDLPGEGEAGLELVNAVLRLPPDAQGDVWVYRGAEWYRRRLVLCWQHARPAAAYRHDGVYAIIGGAGGLGEVFSEHLVREFQAQVVWIGRREQNAEINAKIARIAMFGPAPTYVQADASNAHELRRAYATAKEQFGVIHGVVHAAIALMDKSLAEMTEDRFRSCLSAKVDVSLQIARIFSAESLDWILFFSSLQSFVKAGGQSNYAAGCTFKDAFAQYLAHKLPCAIKVINWGYWGGTGIVASAEYRERMARLGIGSLEAAEGIEALSQLLNGSINQLAAVKYTRPDMLAYLGDLHECAASAAECAPRAELAQSSRTVRNPDEEFVGGPVDKAARDLDELLARLLAAELASVGLIGGGGQAIQISPTYQRWLQHSLSILSEFGLIGESSGGHWRIAHPDAVQKEALWQEWDERKGAFSAFSSLAAQVNILDATVRVLPEILRGTRAATSVLFPDASLHLVEKLYKDNPIGNYFNAVLTDAVAAFLIERRAAEPEARIRLLEIGAGTGGTTEAVLPRLAKFAPLIAEYCYTDLSKVFLMHAEHSYRPAAPYLTTRIFDIDRGLEQQGMPPGQFDIVIAANVLHATKSIRRTLRNAKAALKQGGLLVLNEITGSNLFTHLSFGLLDGWWLYEDSALRVAGTPALSSETWQRVLEAEGFVSIDFPASPWHRLGQQIIAAQSDGIIRQQSASDAKAPTMMVLKTSPLRPHAEQPMPLPDAAAKQPHKTGTPASAIAPSSELLRDRAITMLKRMVAETLKMLPQKLDENESLEVYGIDSILVGKLRNQLLTAFPDISATLFFEYRTVATLADYFLEHHPVEVSHWLGIDEPASDAANSALAELPAIEMPNLHRRQRRGRRDTAALTDRATSQQPGVAEIAVIGLAGRYPGARNVSEFWENLKNGRNCIREIPAKRWNWRCHSSAERGPNGKTYARWGGFLDDIDMFDPLFFPLSPAEAERMDPQERLFLEEAYASIEDAGYSPATLSPDRKVGVYVGVIYSNYADIPCQWSVPNRVSFLLNFQGPSIAVDTACSSSLTALHLAVEGLRNRDCGVAIAGGVNLIVSPDQYLNLSSINMLTSGNRCKAFGEGADGFVDGEGVGAVVLKQLNRAIADGDHIYGVIKASALNAGGRTNGYTVPNPAAQSDVIGEAISRAGVEACAISYIEAHGTGTELGDPIEIEGLRQAFAKNLIGKLPNTAQPCCAIGSLKSNVGHLESAAGIASLTKVLLQMKHRLLAPSLHAEVLNPHIDFSRTPFRVQQELSEWKRPVVEIDGQVEELPLLAGLSSFGAGGANAHLLVEEYRPDPSADTARLFTSEDPALIVLSAKDEARLNERVEQLSLCLTAPSWTDAGLRDLAYTLQVGREAMDCRIAMTAVTILELRQKLDKYLQSKFESGEIDGCYRGDVRNGREAASIFAADEDLQSVVESWIVKRKYWKLLDAWCKGLAVDWAKLYQDGRGRPRRTSLPSYPFARERYWKEPMRRRAASVPWLHPLLQRNTSSLTQQRFSTTFTGEEPYLQDHLVFGRKILPGVCYIEMARAAVLMSLEAEHGEVELQEIQWLHPIAATGAVEVHIALNAQSEKQIGFEVYSERADTEIIHARGRALVTTAGTPNTAKIDLDQLRQACTESINAERCYETFSSVGLKYGPTQRGLQSIATGKNSSGKPFVLAKLALPEAAAVWEDDQALHPSLLDSALQAAIGFRITDETNNGFSLAVPSALACVRILGRVPAECWAYACASELTADGGQRLDIKLCDDFGRLCVELCGLTLHLLADTPESEFAVTLAQPITHQAEAKANSALENSSLLRERAIAAMKRIVGQTLRVSPQQLRENESLESYGIDSILVGNLRSQLAEIFPDVSATLFFERRTVAALAHYFIENQTAAVRRWVGIEETTPIANPPEPATDRSVPQMHTRRRKHTDIGRWMVRRADAISQQPAAIAIIGLSGRYPQARNVAEFWTNLKNGRHCVTEIPAQRWDWRQYYAQEKGILGKSYSKWGGFLDGIDEFDPLFFHLSPAEAERMDPQERLFLEEAYRTVEDSGYTAATLSASGNVGVYAGVMNSNYALQSSRWSIANRVSFLFNFHGPSMAVDTACSSSLTALHLAVEALRRGECEAAIAGGVNLIVDPVQYTNLSAMMMLSADDRCKAFGAGADGFVDGEGVGAVLLKPLDRAIADHDHIYGVILASVLNSGGRTNGYTVPNPTVQGDLVYRAIQSAGIDARAISYIEAHGTGTELGDPIEIEGLRQAFQKCLPAEQSGRAYLAPFCAIGSVKPTIGHLESAAGIAGLTKVLLQMQHRALVPSLHAEDLNPHIDFSRTPFQVQREACEWKRPVLDVDGQSREMPLLAGISSFGAGGSNAHVLISEYRPEAESDESNAPAASRKTAFIVLSAKNAERLTAQVGQLLQHIDSMSYADSDLADIAFTLQVGRDAMESRLAFMVNSIGQLRQKLEDYCHGKFESGEIEECHRGDISDSRDAIASLNVDEDVELLIDSWLAKGKYAKLLDLWVKGLDFDWNRLYVAMPASGQRRLRRISLPGYPFAAESYWRPAHQSRDFVPPLEPVAQSPRQALSEVTPLDLLPETIEEEIERFLVDALGLTPSQIERNRNLSEYGIDSVVNAKLLKHLEIVFGIEVKLRELFEYPTVSGIARRAAAQKSNNVHTAGSGHVQDSSAQISIPKRNPGDRIPLTPPQRSIYLHEQTTAEPVYHVPVTLLVHGQLRADALQQALEAAVWRHESLRTTFVFEHGDLWQQVHEKLPPAWTYLDHRGAAREDSVESWRRIASQPFDLDKGPLLRATLIRRDEEWLLGICAHHLVMDGWSFAILLDELQAAYASIHGNRPYEAPALPCQYGDYAIWRQLDNSAEKSAAVRLAERLKDVPNLNLAHWLSRRPALPSLRGGTRHLRISPESSSRIRNAAAQADCSVFGFMTASLELVLARLSGQPRFAIGVPFACRKTAEIAGLIGHFANTVPIVAEPTLQDTFIDLLSQVRAQLTLAQRDEAASLEETLSLAAIQRDPRFSPLFQIMCVMQPTRILDLPETGIRMEFLPVDFGTTLFDLVLQVVESGSQFDAVLTFNKDVAGDERADLILSALLSVIESASGNPLQSVHQLLESLPQCIVPVAVWGDHGGEIASGLRTLAEVANLPLCIVDSSLLHPVDPDALRSNIAPESEFVHVVNRDPAATAPLAAPLCLLGSVEKELGKGRPDAVVIDIGSPDSSSASGENALGVERHSTPSETAEAVFAAILQALHARGLWKQIAPPHFGVSSTQGFSDRPSDASAATSIAGEEGNACIDCSEDVLGWLRSLWAKSLGRPSVELDDDFILLGGTSLAALRVLARVRERFGVDLPLRAIFESPTVMEFAAQHFPAGTAALPPQESSSTAASSGPVPVSTGSSAAASVEEVRIALLDCLDPGSGAYNIPLFLSIRGPLDIEALEAALNAIDARHEPLRTAITLADGKEYIQIVHKHRSEPLNTTDLSDLTTPARATRLEQIRKAEAAYPFDLTGGLLWKRQLVRCSRDEHYLLITLHHAVCDASSIKVLAGEIAEGYGAAVSGRSAQLPDLSVRYLDYAIWQRSMQNRFASQLDYWKVQLSGVPRLDLPTDRPRTTMKRGVGGLVSGRIPKEITRNIRELAAAQGCTPFMVLLAAFSVVLHNHTAQTDILIGSTVAGRRHPSLEPLIGCFVNTLALRVQCMPDNSFLTVLERARQVVGDGVLNQDCPIEQVLNMVKRSAEGDQSPLIHVLFNFLDVSANQLQLEGLEVEAESSPRLVSKVDLDLFGREEAGEIVLELEYDSNLFESASCAWIVDHLIACAKEIVNRPFASVRELSSAAFIAPEVEAEWPLPLPASFVPIPAEVTLAGRIAAVCREHPGLRAIVDGPTELTYREFDAASAQLAACIASRWSGHERIALLCSHDWRMPVAVAAVLRAAKTYVPLDPRAPDERLAAILADCEVSAIVCCAEFLERTQALSRSLARDGYSTLETLEISSTPDTKAPYPSVAVHQNSDAPAYVLYTSGSTGKPKGVVQTRKNVVTHIRNYAQRIGISPGERLVMLASYVFDAGVMDLFGAILTGGTLLLVDPRAQEPSGLRSALADANILHSTPTMFRYLLQDTERPWLPRGARVFVLGGEEVRASDLSLFEQHFSPSCLLVNGYGPTECTLAFQYCVARGDDQFAAVPIGRPVPGVSAELVDEAGNAVPICGEIVLHSSSLAAGYWRQPEAAALAFSMNEAGVRTYRTGDFGRRRHDGSLIFVGRKDQQVKIRGHRVETGEIESLLRMHPAVNNAAVAAIRNSDESMRLAAYVCCGLGLACEPAELQLYLRRKLPEYAVPGSIVLLESLPLTLTGKVDRQRLPEAPPPAVASVGAPPRTDMEKTIAIIWEEVLGVTGIGRDQNFFDAGGDSLLLARVQNKLAAGLGSPIQMVDLFTHSTVSALAAVLDQQQIKGNQPQESNWRTEMRRNARMRHAPVGTEKSIEEVTL